MEVYKKKDRSRASTNDNDIKLYSRACEHEVQARTYAKLITCL